MQRRDIPARMISPVVVSHTNEGRLAGRPIRFFSKDVLNGFNLAGKGVQPAQENYRNFERFLLCHYDSLNNIHTSIEEKDVAAGKRMPVMVRDARDALPLDQRLSPNHPLFAINNSMLQTLGIVRTLDHLLESRARSNPKHAEEYQALREAVRKEFEAYAVRLIYFQKTIAAGRYTEEQCLAYIKQQQTECSNALINIIHQASLDRGVPPTQKGYARLLNHYRQMAALLDPAMAMQTIIEDKTNNVVQVDTALPITTKTQKQKKFIWDRIQKGYMHHPKKDEKNFHTKKPIAYQEVDLAFETQLVDDTRRLPAQARKDFPTFVKNGYVTRQDLFFPEQSVSETVWGVRSATMPYVGSGETGSDVQEQVRENFVQMRTALTEYGAGVDHSPALHFMILNTNTSLENQDVMVAHTVSGATASEVSVSRLPLNIHGTLEGATLAPEIAQQASYTSHLYIPFNKSRSLDVAMRTAAMARQQGKVNAVACASGQDRTGGLKEADGIESTFEAYQRQGIKIDREAIAQRRVAGGHNVMLTSLAVPGSPGMKTDSIPGTYFSSVVTEHMYLASASSNKKVALTLNGVQAAVATQPKAELVDDYIATAEQIYKFANRSNWNPFLWKDEKKTQALHALARSFEKEARQTGIKRTREQIVQDWESDHSEEANVKAKKAKNKEPDNSYGAIIKRRRFNLLGSKDAKSRTETFVDTIKKPPSKSAGPSS